MMPKVFGMCPTMGIMILTLRPGQGQPIPLAHSKTKSSGAELTFNIFLGRKREKEEVFLAGLKHP